MVKRIQNHLVLSPQYEAGSKVVEADIARHLNCSRAPVREALKYLASMGLVDIIPNRGAFIAELDAEQIREVFELRVLIEGNLIEKVIMRDLLSQEDFACLEEYVAAMVKAASDGSDITQAIQIIVQNDLLFHRRIWDAANQPYFSNALEAIHNKLILSMYKDYYSRTEMLLDDVSMHYDIIKYLKKGHVAMTLKALQEHVGLYYNNL